MTVDCLSPVSPADCQLLESAAAQEPGMAWLEHDRRQVPEVHCDRWGRVEISARIIWEVVGSPMVLWRAINQRPPICAASLRVVSLVIAA